MTRDLDWFPDLPAGWQCKPLKAVCDYRVSNVDKVPADGELPVRLCNYTDVYHNEFIRLDMDLMHTTATQAEIERFGLAVDDVVITKDSETWDDIGVPAVIAESAPDLVCGYHLAMLRPSASELDGRYLFRCLQARPMQFQFERTATGVTRFGLGLDAIGRLYLPVPPLSRQRAIAAYLDRETAKIDAMIAAKDHQLSLLTEKRRAIITHAVTRGIDPNAAMRDSGDQGLGVVPAHWTVCHLRRVLSDSTYGISATAGPDGTVPMLRMGDIVDGEIRYSKLAYVEEVDGSLLLNAGDLLFNRTNSLDQIGKVGIVRSSGVFPCTFASYLVRLRTNGMAAPDYLHQLLNSDYCLAWARGEAIPAIGQANLNPFRYGYMTIAVPPLHEQRMIVTHLADITSHIDAVALGTKHTVSLLKERRIALIAAAVSGQIDLEDAA
jgi:type I restriction enzyme S subunit